MGQPCPIPLQVAARCRTDCAHQWSKQCEFLWCIVCKELVACFARPRACAGQMPEQRIRLVTASLALLCRIRLVSVQLHFAWPLTCTAGVLQHSDWAGKYHCQVRCAW